MMAALRLHAPAGKPTSEGDPRRRLTLRECFEAYCVPELVADGRRPQTFLQYRSMLAAWERLTDNPGVGELDDQAIECWRQARGKEVSDATVDKDARMMRRIFNLIGPRTSQHRGAAEILLPWPPRVRMFGARGRRTKRKRPVTNDVWRSLWAATRYWHFTTSGRIPGPLAARLAIVGVHSTGLRESDLFRLTWGNIIDDRRCPVAGWPLTHPHGWLWISADNPAGGLQRSTKTGKEHCIPLTRCLRATIDEAAALLARPSASPYLIPLGGPDETMRRTRLTFMHVLNDVAGLGAPHYTWHPLRLGANEAWHAAKEGAGHHLLQHSFTSVNECNYRLGIQDLMTAAERIGFGPFGPLVPE